MKTRIGTATILVTALVGAALAASPTGVARHYECPPDASPEIHIGPAEVDCAAQYNSAPYKGCDGPVDSYVAVESFTVGDMLPADTGTDADDAPVNQAEQKFYLCLSQESSDNGIWKETNDYRGLQTAPDGIWGSADTKCAEEPAACMAGAAAMP